MHIAFNFLVIVGVILIAYWWSNQGLFSSLLHMAAVIVAGAITISVWELVSWDLALGNLGGFDNYVAGISFILIFAGTLVLLRVATDRFAPEDVEVNATLELAGGFTFGAVSGILSIGLLIIGTGFIQRPLEFMGYKGYGREAVGNSQIGPVGPQLWLPVDYLTSNFYELASINGLRPDITGTPLKQYNPNLYMQASLVRDSLDGERGQAYMIDGAASAKQPSKSEFMGKHWVTVPMEFTSEARDFGQQLVLSKSQVRLVGEMKGSSTPEISYPTYWIQDSTINKESKDTAIGLYRFDDSSNYITSVPGQSTASAKIIFEVSDDFTPLFIQIKGLRIDLRESTDRDLRQIIASAKALGAGEEFEDEPGGDITNTITVGNTLRFLRGISKNKMPSSMKEENGLLTNGFMKVQGGSAGRVNRGLQIKGIAQTEGTKIVRIDISRYSPANLFSKVRKMIGPNAEIQLIDIDGNTFAPIGFYYMGRGGIEVKLDRRNYIKTLEQIGTQPPSGSEKEMSLLFEVTRGSTLDSLRVGDVEVGFIDGVEIE